MVELDSLKKGEAEIFVRQDKSILSVKLPPPLVEKLTEMQKEMEAGDILEVLIKSAETMISTMHSLKCGRHSKEKEEGEIEITKTAEEESTDMPNQ